LKEKRGRQGQVLRLRSRCPRPPGPPVKEKGAKKRKKRGDALGCFVLGAAKFRAEERLKGKKRKKREGKSRRLQRTATINLAHLAVLERPWRRSTVRAGETPPLGGVQGRRRRRLGTTRARRYRSADARAREQTTRGEKRKIKGEKEDTGLTLPFLPTNYFPSFCCQGKGEKRGKKGEGGSRAGPVCYRRLDAERIRLAKGEGV